MIVISSGIPKYFGNGKIAERDVTPYSGSIERRKPGSSLIKLDR